jgi:hypothetical protein
MRGPPEALYYQDQFLGLISAIYRFAKFAEFHNYLEFAFCNRPHRMDSIVDMIII